jgi:branched-chain amino acid transport system substrate-binding protein
VEKGVVALTGGIWNPMSAALNEECKITPIIYIPGYVPAMDAFKKGNPAVCTFTPTFTPWSIGYITGQAVIQTLGKKTIYYVERADSWGSTIREGLEAACAKFGGRIIGVDQVSLGTPDYSPIITKAIQAHPDAFVTSLAGGDAIANLKQAYDMGLYDKTLMFNCWTANVVAKGIPDKALENLYALVWFYYDLEGLHNPALVAKVKAYSDAFWKRWNEPPDNMGTACYVAMQFIFRAVEKTGTFDPAAVANYLMNNKVDTVKGPQQFRADREPVSDNMCFLLRGKAASEKRNEWDYFEVVEAYGGDEALPSLASMGY